MRRRTLTDVADMICGNVTREDEESYFQYRSSSYLTEFFADCDMEQFVHDGSTRKWWVAGVLEQIVQQPSDGGLSRFLLNFVDGVSRCSDVTRLFLVGQDGERLVRAPV